MEIQNNAALQLALWLKRKYPKLYAASISSRGLSGLGDTAPSTSTTPAATTGWLDTLTGMLKQAVPVYLSTYQQKQLIDINIERAKQGLPPVDQSSIAPQVNVSLPPEQMNQITSAGKYALIGVGVLGVAFLLSKRKR